MSSLPQFILDRAASFTGDGHKLERALGAYSLGQLYGWRVLRMLHSGATIANYEAILGDSFENLCPERTSLSSRNLGLRIADALSSFWRVARGHGYASSRSHFEDDPSSSGSLL